MILIVYFLLAAALAWLARRPWGRLILVSSVLLLASFSLQAFWLLRDPLPAFLSRRREVETRLAAHYPGYRLWKLKVNFPAHSNCGP